MTAPGPVADAPATPSTTARTLRRLRGALVAGSLLTGALCLVVSGRAHAGSDAVGGRAAPAVLRAEAAYGALADAQRAAVQGFLQETVVLGGLGDRYRNDIAAINQNLAELARYDVAGPTAASDMQRVEGLVVNYNTQIEQAAADYRRSGSLTQALPALWYAELQYREASETLDVLRQDGKTALAARLDSVWLADATDLLFLVPFALVLALFARTQVVLRRRFRRRLNAWLAPAVLALTATALWCGLSLHAADERLRSALDGPWVDAVVLAEEQATRSAGLAADDLFEIVARACTATATTSFCGTGLTPSSTTATEVTPEEGRRLGRAEADFTERSARADASSSERLTAVVLLTLAAAAASAGALNRRIDEYRFGGR
ncbi:hypothetical protein ACFVVL_13675 [Kitasatospora sp. NPDC058115]|uniref:hypothetical protein n=1 Tax=Kitasatospora sp. NPDC058115 TaxID=3346347 RepID=UPI0036D81F0B